jgi:dUTP pyrophosphatase
LIELPVRRLRDGAVMPERAYAGDAGLDLAACERAELAPGARATVGAARHGITIVNSPGLVDSGYRGELRIVLLNTDQHETFVVEPGMRIAQLVILAVPELELAVVDELPSSERGVRGFGSTAH